MSTTNAKTGANSGDAVTRMVKLRIDFLWAAARAALSAKNGPLSSYYLNALIQFAKHQDIEFDNTTAVCTKCASLLVPGVTARVKLASCADISNEAHSKMISDMSNVATLSDAKQTQRAKPKNCLILKCKSCAHYIALPGAPKPNLPKVNISNSKPKASSSGSSRSKEPSQPSQGSSTGKKSDETAKKVQQTVSKEDERKKLLASMLKASTPIAKPQQKPGNKPKNPPTVPAAAPKKAPGKKSLFSFLNSL